MVLLFYFMIIADARNRLKGLSISGRSIYTITWPCPLKQLLPI